MQIITRSWNVHGVPAVAVRPRRILIADEDNDNADSLSLLLQLRGHATEVAYDGIDALRRAGHFHPEIALIDYDLPDIDGNQIAASLRTQAWAKNLKLIAMSGWHGQEDFQHAEQAGFAVYLLKPIEFEILQQLL